MSLAADLPRRPRSTGRHERGSVTIQLVILMPALFVLMFTGMQAALIYHARTVAIAAAEEGARAAGAQDGTGTRGAAAATDFVHTAGGDNVLRAVTTRASRTPTDATVTVTGLALSVVPGWSPTISQSATVPVERLTP